MSRFPALNSIGFFHNSYPPFANHRPSFAATDADRCANTVNRIRSVQCANYGYRLPPRGLVSYHGLVGGREVGEASNSRTSLRDPPCCVVRCTAPALARDAIRSYPALHNRSLLCCQRPCSAYPLSSCSIPPYLDLSFNTYTLDSLFFCSFRTDHLLLDKSNRLCPTQFHIHLQQHKPPRCSSRALSPTSIAHSISTTPRLLLSLHDTRRRNASSQNNDRP